MQSAFQYSSFNNVDTLKGILSLEAKKKPNKRWHRNHTHSTVCTWPIARWPLELMRGCNFLQRDHILSWPRWARYGLWRGGQASLDWHHDDDDDEVPSQGQEGTVWVRDCAAGIKIQTQQPHLPEPAARQLVPPLAPQGHNPSALLVQSARGYWGLQMGVFQEECHTMKMCALVGCPMPAQAL